MINPKAESAYAPIVPAILYSASNFFRKINKKLTI